MSEIINGLQGRVEVPTIHASLSNPTYTGAPGYTPVKGVDYYTEAEKADLLDELGEQANQIIIDAIQDMTGFATKEELEELENAIPDVSGLATVAMTGDYEDLNNLPTIPTVPTNISEFTNDAGYQTASNVATAISGKQDALTAGAGIIIEDDEITYDPEEISSVQYVDDNISDTMNYVMDNYQRKLTAGTNITISAQHVISASGGGAVSSVNGKTGAVVLDAEDVGALPDDTELFSGDYNDLTNKPTIPTVPTNVSAFTNDAGYLTQHQSLASYATQSWVEGKGYAVSADLADVASSGDYNDLSNTPTIPTVDVDKAYVDQEIERVEDEIPTVPTNVSAFTNDAGYLTQHQDISNKQDTLIAGNNITIGADGKTISATNTTYTAGSNITITNGVISATDTIYTAGTNITIENGIISASGGGAVSSVNGKTGAVVLDYEDVGALSEDTELFSGDYNDLTNKPTIPTVDVDKNYVDTQLALKQNNIIAGSNITIGSDGKTINATDTTYTAGSGISITNNVISATGGGGGEPNEYIKSASVSSNTLTLTKKDNTTITFTPSGGSGGESGLTPLLLGYINAYQINPTNPSTTLEEKQEIVANVIEYANHPELYYGLIYNAVDQKNDDKYKYNVISVKKHDTFKQIQLVAIQPMAEFQDNTIPIYQIVFNFTSASFSYSTFSSANYISPTILTNQNYQNYIQSGGGGGFTWTNDFYDNNLYNASELMFVYQDTNDNYNWHYSYVNLGNNGNAPIELNTLGNVSNAFYYLNDTSWDSQSVNYNKYFYYNGSSIEFNNISYSNMMIGYR